MTLSVFFFTLRISNGLKCWQPILRDVGNEKLDAIDRLFMSALKVQLPYCRLLPTLGERTTLLFQNITSCNQYSKVYTTTKNYCISYDGRIPN